MLAVLAQAPALWGVLGAFIYAAPRWVACLVACRQAGAPGWHCSGEFAVALGTGAIAAGAFAHLVLGLSHVKDANAVAAAIGLLANPVAPRITVGLAGVVAGAINSKLGKALGADSGSTGTGDGK